MVKVYYQYEFSQTIAQPINGQCNFVLLPDRKIMIAGVNQYVCVIGIKTGEPIKYLYQDKKNINVRHLEATQNRLYVGYEDGHISIYELDTWSFVSCLDMHKSAITSIDIDQNDTKMVSGCMSGTICIWDLLSEDMQKIEKAHSASIVQIIFQKAIIGGKPLDVAFSLSRDGFLKIWNAEINLCLSAITTQTTQAYSMAFNDQNTHLYIGSNKEVIPIVKFNTHSQVLSNLIELVGMAKRPNYSRVIQIIHEYGKLYLLNSDKKIEIYQVLPEEKLSKKLKRVISRKKQTNNNSENEQMDDKIGENSEIVINKFEMSVSFVQEKTFLEKVHNFEVNQSEIFYNNGKNLCKIKANIESGEEGKHSHEITSFTAITQQICLEFPYLIQRTKENILVYNCTQFNLLYKIEQKSSCVSLFGGFLMICCNQELKVWDLAKNQQVFSVLKDWAGCWVLKNKCLLWKENTLGVHEIGYDKSKKIRIKQIENKILEEKITGAIYTPDMQKYAANLQNCQIHIFYADSHKQFLKLYGHKLPISDFDISSDGSLLVSCSVDKDIRFWDMDYGHCIKSVFAHELPVSMVKFMKDTHYVISTSKDAHVKMWDGDTHELIQDFEQSMLEVRSLAISSSCDFITAGGLDGGFRIWKQTNNQTVASDQEEKRMEKVMVEEYSSRKLANNADKTSYDDLKHGQEIIEALEQDEKPLVLLKILKRIPNFNLKSSLSFLHVQHRKKLQQYLNYFIDRQYEMEVSYRILDAIQSSSKMGSLLRTKFEETSDTLGINKELIKVMLKFIKEKKMMF